MIPPLSGQNPVKPYETRHWKTAFRGYIAIHAAKNDGDMYLLGYEKYLTPISRAGYNKFNLPMGAILGVSKLVDIIPAEEAEDKTFGDFTKGRWAWVMEFQELFPTPIAFKGDQGLWNWDFDRTLIHR